MIGEELHKPLYARIQDYIADLILTGKLTPDSKIQSERDFSADLGVSRMTVRRAITELVHEGLLERKHGSGTYVAKPKVTYEAGELVDYMEAMHKRNIATASQLLEFQQVAASRRLADLLALQIGDSIYRICILRLANRVPAVLERDFVACSRCPGLEEWNLEKSPISDLMTAIYNITPRHISQTVEAVIATDVVAQQLRVVEGFPLLMLSRVTFGGSQEPVMFSQDFLRSDYARIHADAELDARSPLANPVGSRKEVKPQVHWIRKAE